MTNFEKIFLETNKKFIEQASDEFKEKLVEMLDKAGIIEEFLDVDIIIDEKMELLKKEITAQHNNVTYPIY